MRGQHVTLALALVLACRQERYPDEVTAPKGGERFAIETTSLFAGPPQRQPDIENPYEGNVHAVQEGERFYTWFNCAGCHGAIGGGGIGPPLRDREWIYGSRSVQVYRSIVEGRPNGMPSFRGIPDEAAWKIVAFVRAFGGAPGEKPGAVDDEPQEHKREARADEESHGDR